MMRKVWKELLLAVLVLCFGGVDAFSQETDPVMMEEMGLDTPTQAPNKAGFLGSATRATEFLMIPESSNDTVGMFDPYDGTYLGDLISGFGEFSTPINAVLGPDGNIYVSDQVADSVFVFDKDGNYLFTYADSSDGLNNIRGIDFRDGHLFVTSGDDYVAEFQGPHDRLPDFIADGSDPFDILFLADGRSLLCDIQGSDDNVRLYDVNGVLISELFKTAFPEQVQFDSVLPGAYLVNSFSDDVVLDFEEDGSIVETTPAGDRGVYRLGNGNLLITNGSGTFEIEPVTGNIIEQEHTGSARFIELYKEPEVGVVLAADTDEISAREPNDVNFKLSAGPDNAGLNYLLLGGVTGTDPGTVLPGGAVLPLNLDYFTVVVYSLINTSLFQDFMGVLDNQGNAKAQLHLSGSEPISPDCIGVVLYFAYGVYKPYDASNAVKVLIVP
jgi:outer membrane protein assembly factor BamB